MFYEPYLPRFNLNNLMTNPEHALGEHIAWATIATMAPTLHQRRLAAHKARKFYGHYISFKTTGTRFGANQYS